MTPYDRRDPDYQTDLSFFWKAGHFVLSQR